MHAARTVSFTQLWEQHISCETGKYEAVSCLVWLVVWKNEWVLFGLLVSLEITFQHFVLFFLDFHGDSRECWSCSSRAGWFYMLLLQDAVPVIVEPCALIQLVHSSHCSKTWFVCLQRRSSLLAVWCCDILKWRWVLYHWFLLLHVGQNRLWKECLPRFQC